MLIILGVLSFFQLVFLPGIIICRLIKINGFWENILCSIGLSPIFNYFFVLVSTLLGIYTQTLVLVLFCIEIILALYLYFPIINQNLKQVINISEIKIFFVQYLDVSSEKKSFCSVLLKVFYILIFLIALGSIFYYFKLYGTDTSSIFTLWDAVVSWDRWAVDWFSNQFPSLTFHYPQLMPANYSLTYQFMGTSEIKFFAKNYANYIEIFILLTIFILGLVKRKAGYFLAVPITAWLQLRLGSQGSGYVDSPVAFFGLLAITFLLFSVNHKDYKKFILIGAVFTAGAALTKQAGFWIIVNYLLFVFLIYRKTNKQLAISLIKQIIIIDFALVLPWYIYKEIEIHLNIDVSEIAYVTTLGSQGKNIVETFLFAVKQLFSHLSLGEIPGYGTAIVLGIFLLFSYRDKFWGKVASFITLPFVLIWIFFFCYDIRNFNLIVPLLGIGCGVGLQNIFESEYSAESTYLFNKVVYWIYQKGLMLIKKLSQMLVSIKVVFGILILGVIFLLPLKYSDEYLLEKSYVLQKTIGYEELNDMLYAYNEDPGFNGIILSDYFILGYLPELSQYYELANENSPEFMNIMERPEIGYVMLDLQSQPKEVQDYYRQLVKQEKIKMRFFYNQIQFYEKLP